MGRITKILILILAILYGAYYWAVPTLVELPENITFEEIKENDFCLSVNTYLQEHAKQEYMDPMILVSEARQSFLKRFRRELEFEKTVCDMEGISIKPFLRAIKNILLEFERKEKKEDENQMKLEV